jgi:hypothetical protein
LCGESEAGLVFTPKSHTDGTLGRLQPAQCSIGSASLSRAATPLMLLMLLMLMLLMPPLR